MSKQIGTKPYQTPRNADLGTLAYQDADNVSVDNIKANRVHSENLNLDAILSVGDNYPLVNKRPSLRLDFDTSGVSHPDISHGMFSNRATFFDKHGNMTNSLPGQGNIPKARIDHDPLTLRCRGLLVERNWTNFVNSSTLYWGVGRSTRSDNAVIKRGIMGYIYSDNGSGNPNINNNISTTTDGTWCYSTYIDVSNVASSHIKLQIGANGNASRGIAVSFYFSQTNGEYDQCTIDTPSYGDEGTPGSGIMTKQYIGNNIWRLSVSFSLNKVVSTIFPVLYFGPSGTSNDVWIGGSQLEVSREYPSSLILNDYTNSQVDRNAATYEFRDINEYTDTAEGFSLTYEVESVNPPTSSNGHALSLHGDNFIFFYGSTGAQNNLGAAVRTSAGYQFAASAPVETGEISKAGASLVPNNGAIAVNGEIIATDSSFEPITQTTMQIGRGPGTSNTEYYDGYIRKIRIYNCGLTQAELKELTR